MPLGRRLCADEGMVWYACQVTSGQQRKGNMRQQGLNCVGNSVPEPNVRQDRLTRATRNYAQLPGATEGPGCNGLQELAVALSNDDQGDCARIPFASRSEAARKQV